jgi:hypothetical protein
VDADSTVARELVDALPSHDSGGSGRPELAVRDHAHLALNLLHAALVGRVEPRV